MSATAWTYETHVVFPSTTAMLTGRFIRDTRDVTVPQAAAIVTGTRSSWHLGTAIERLKHEPGKGLSVGGVTLPLALAELGLIDEYEFVVHPTIAGHGPTLFAGLSKHLELKLVSRREFASGAVAMRYELASANRI